MAPIGATAEHRSLSRPKPIPVCTTASANVAGTRRGPHSGADRRPEPASTRYSEVAVKAIVATDQAAEAAGITLAERPAPTPAINDVVVEVHASGFVPA